MPRVWLITTHLLTLLAIAPSLASAQLGRALDGPTPGLAEALSAPGAAETGPAEAGPAESGPAETPSGAAPVDEAASSALGGWNLDVTAVTSLPVTVGVGAQLTAPFGLGAYLEVGHTPGAYMGAVASMLQDSGAYNPRVRPLIDEATGDGGVNTRLGLVYAHESGFEVAAGYTYLGLSSALTQGAIQTALNRGYRWPPGMDSVPLSIDVHALSVRAGWSFVIERHLVLRFALGWTHAVATSARLTVPDAVREMDGDPATQMEEALERGLGEYGFTPELIVGAGYRF